MGRKTPARKMFLSAPPASTTVPAMSEVLERFAQTLSAAIARDFGGPELPSPEGYEFARVRLRMLQGKNVPVVEFTKNGQTLSFIITRTNPAAPAYRRSTHYDIVYFSEDVADAEQSKIYARDRAVIDRFAAWIVRWDNHGGGHL
jgi:hypothetical protein